MTRTQQLNELRHRVEAKRKRLEARIAETKADASAQASETAESLRSSLKRLDDHLREGWDNLTDATVGKINTWLKDDEQ